MNKALFLSADNFEDSELLVPYYRLLEAGFTVDIASTQRNPIKGKHGYEVPVTKTFAEINPADYDLLVLPGGKAPAAIRSESKVKEIARYFFEHQRPVAAICHGPQILASAGLLKGRRATCYREVVHELQEIGAQYEDREVVVDGMLITSREPKDLPAFNREIMKLVQQRRPH